MAQIKKDTSLRKAILQAAITGQLISDIGGESLPLAAAGKPSSATPSAGTPRNTPTETGKQLLDRIIEERNNKLLAEWEEKQTDLFASNDAHSKNAKTVRSEQIRLLKKAKKPAPIVASEIDEEEIPFEIPENWCWCRLEDLVTILGDGLHGTPQYDISGEFYFVNGNNLNNGVIEIKPDTKKINEKEFEKYKKDLNETTIFVSINGTIGNIAFYNNEKIILGKSACYFNVAIEDLKKYFFYLFQTDFFLNYALDNATGTTIKNVGLGTMRNFLLPLPPLSVQNAIVAKLEQVLPLVDAYENAVLQKEELKSALSDKVKKAILQEAITGQLTENWRKSATIKESGKQLLYRIIEERNAKALADWEEALKKNPKAKKPVPVVASEIDEEEIPFEVPESWCWCHLGEIFKVTMGQSPEGSNVGEEKEGMEFHQGKIFFTDKYIATSNQKTSEITKIAEPGSILLCMRAPVGKVNITDRQICIGRGLSSIVPLGEIALEWAFHLFETLESDFIDKSTGSTFKAITGDVVKEQLIPLPPLEEQEEIVKKLEELLPLCK